LVKVNNALDPAIETSVSARNQCQSIRIDLDRLHPGSNSNEIYRANLITLILIPSYSKITAYHPIICDFTYPLR
jgi:hypothetical protein